MEFRNSDSASKDRSQETSVPDFPKYEEDVLRFWHANEIFSKALEKTKGGKPFIFYEGPPTANGKAGIHHVLSRAFKDVVVRFRTMQGRFVSRRAGWDTHGLPVELKVEKEFGISGKKQIENIVPNDRRASIAAFNARCKTDVTSLISEWESITQRIGYWLDFDHDYRTYTNDYVESLWWIIKQFSETNTPEGPLLFQGHKVVHHCPRCDTALSSHEVAQGYKTVQDTSVYVKFKVRKTNVLKAQALMEEGKEVNILSWTTTPWTLPGNVALAVHRDFTYVLVEYEDGLLILAKDRMQEVLEGKGKVLLEFRGKDLVGTQYEPLSPGCIDAGDSQTAWTVLHADFVTGEDGTGIVHTAVMYGEDDYRLGIEQKLPREHTVDTTGHFLPKVKQFSGMFVKDPKTEKAIIDELFANGRLLRIEPYSHEYPFCWRCSTPLLYYAKDSWFIRMSSLRKQLQQSNASINWIPSHIKEGRFGEWLKDTKDWAFSRERYWGTPLPIWICPSCGKREVIGSFKELEKRAIQNTLPEDSRTIHLMRHGQAGSNVERKVSSVIEKDRYHLTDAGRKDVEAEAKKLKGKIDLIVASDFMRTRETAEIVAKETGAALLFDPRLRELLYPSYEGKNPDETEKEFPEEWMRWEKSPEGGEKLMRAARRLQEAIIDALQQFDKQRILFVSHGDPIWAFLHLQSGKEAKAIGEIQYPKLGKSKRMTLHAIPLNPHRPYVDDIELPCDCKAGAVKRRVEEVADVWFDSGSMPFAQEHYPFANAEAIDKGHAYPADYISEAIDQTRGWFYTLLAVATCLHKPAPYKNVICLNLVLDQKGEKMSKSKGNIVDPKLVIGETGADALRMYFYSVNQPSEYKLFALEGVQDVVRKTLMILWNVQSFYLMYAPKGVPNRPLHPKGVLNQWMLAACEETRAKVTEHLEKYHIFEAARGLRDFITELSVWYVRRSRSAVKAGDTETIATLGFAIHQTALLLAPLTPFFSEMLYQRMKSKSNKPMSIHLADWPQVDADTDSTLLKKMLDVRSVVELLHSVRKESAIPSRQPLEKAWVNSALDEHLARIIAEEVNVDAVLSGGEEPAGNVWKQKERGSLRVGLNVTITAQLQRRGKIREYVRHINDLRKSARLTPEDTIDIYIEASEATQEFLREITPEIISETKSKKIAFGLPDDCDVKKTVKLKNEAVAIGIKRVA